MLANVRTPLHPTTKLSVTLLVIGDPLLRELETKIVSAQLSQPSGADKAGRKKKAAAATTDPLLEVILHDTVIFPEGGGQPSDIGRITTQDGRTWDVLEAKRHGGYSVNYVRINQVDADIQAFTVGSPVTVALGEDGFKRRLDHVH